MFREGATCLARHEERAVVGVQVRRAAQSATQSGARSSVAHVCRRERFKPGRREKRHRDEKNACHRDEKNACHRRLWLPVGRVLRTRSVRPLLRSDPIASWIAHCHWHLLDLPGADHRDSRARFIRIRFIANCHSRNCDTATRSAVQAWPRVARHGSSFERWTRPACRGKGFSWTHTTRNVLRARMKWSSVACRLSPRDISARSRAPSHLSTRSATRHNGPSFACAHAARAHGASRSHPSTVS